MGNSPSVLGTTCLPLLGRRRNSWSEDASTCVNDLCDLLAWRVSTGLSDSVSLSQDQGNGRKRRRRLLVVDTLSCAVSAIT